MRNYILGAAAIIVIAVALLVTFPLIKDLWNDDPVDPNNPNLDATFKQTVVVEYTDGTSETLSSGTVTLEAFRNNKEIQMTRHKLFCKLDDGADSIKIKASDSYSETNLYQGTTLIRGPSIADSGIIPETTVSKGAGWTEITSISVHPNSYIYDVPVGSYTASFEFVLSDFQYYYNDAWLDATSPPKVTFTLDIN